MNRWGIGLVAVLAKSFARIFYRNGFNIGLLLVEVDTDKISDGDGLDIDLEKGVVRNLTRNVDLPIKPLPRFMQELLREGGIIKYFQKYGKLPEV
jgi:3-isopropylmalate/(R)-2-methylmalate dehydratase small subunit